jgi:hypothetical protein
MMDDVVTLVTAAGEMVGRIINEDETSITLENPRAFVQTRDGVGFAPGVCLTGVKDPKEVSYNRLAIILTCETNEEVRKIWLQATTGLVV